VGALAKVRASAANDLAVGHVFGKSSGEDSGWGACRRARQGAASSTMHCCYRIAAQYALDEPELGRENLGGPFVSLAGLSSCSESW